MLLKDGAGDVIVVVITRVFGVPLALLENLAVFDFVDDFQFLLLLSAVGLGLFILG